MTLFHRPDGFEWCGGCGAPTRPLTAGEMSHLMGQAVGLCEVGANPAAVFRELGWYAEMQARSLRPCECPPPAPPSWWSDAPTAGFYVYRLWADDDRLLYVGVSTTTRNRLKAHERKWGDLIARATWEEHADAKSMLAAEREAIRNEHPALNVASVG